MENCTICSPGSANGPQQPKTGETMVEPPPRRCAKSNSDICVRPVHAPCGPSDACIQRPTPAASTLRLQTPPPCSTRSRCCHWDYVARNRTGTLCHPINDLRSATELHGARPATCAAATFPTHFKCDLQLPLVGTAVSQRLCDHVLALEWLAGPDKQRSTALGTPLV